MNGLLRCSRYSFGPNRLHYCGPDANAEILAYINSQAADPGLESVIKRFKTLYPYLKLIAEANHIADPFDEAVVEAYWLGNELLENVGRQKFYQHLLDEQQIKKRIGPKEFEYLTQKIAAFAVPHHSFHVMNIWKRTGHAELEHTLQSLDACRVSWGKVRQLNGPRITVETEPLILRQGKLALGNPVRKKLIRYLESRSDIEQLKAGEIISIHWEVPCETITLKQTADLKKYTLQSIAMANQTV